MKTVIMNQFGCFDSEELEKIFEGAWREMVKEAAKPFDFGEAIAELREFDPIAAKALEMLGWKQLCESPADDVTFRANFRQVYQTAQKRSEEHAQLPPSVAAMLDGARNTLQLEGGE